MEVLLKKQHLRLGRQLLFIVLFTAALLSAHTAAYGQDVGTIAGTVVSEVTGDPLPGVNVMVVDTQMGAATNNDGQFEISNVPPGTYSVRASFVGFGDRIKEGVEVQEGQTTSLTFAMQLQAAGLDEVVVVGYGTQQRKDLTGSVASINAGEMAEDLNVTNVGQLLQGHIPGISAGVATEADGSPGNLQVRGSNSITAGTNPLVVVDGVPYDGPLQDINPEDIASIDVLKGASAAAVYGASSASGVIEVTTKNGSTPAPTVRFKSSYGVATRGRYVEPYGPEEYIRYKQDAITRRNPDVPDNFYTNPNNLPDGVTQQEWLEMSSGSEKDPMKTWLSRIGLSENEIDNYMANRSIDWADQVVRRAARRQNYNISISGKPEVVSYYFSMGYTDNEAEVYGDRFRAIRGRANLSSTVTDWMEVGLKSQYAHRNEGFLGASASQAERVSPLGDKYAEDGTLTWYPHGDNAARNPFLYTKESGREHEAVSSNLIANLHARFFLPFGFNFTTRWANDLDFDRNFLFNPSTTPFGQPEGRARRIEQSNYRWQFDNILKWNQRFADLHEVETTFLFNVEAENYRYTSARNESFPLETLGYSGLPVGSNPTVNSNDTRSTGTALLGRLNYRLLDRYLLTASYRRDGYSAFGQNRPYAYFPSLALAWRVSEEPFFNVAPISNLKLRTSWGKNGNRSIGTYRALQRLGTNKYIYGGETVTGIWLSNLPNHDLKWERTTQYNAGLDLGLFNGRFSGTVDAYYMSTSDLLLNRQLPDITSFSSVITNLGEVVNQGVEVTLESANLQSEAVSWNSTLTFSMNRNTIKELYGTGENDRQNGWFLGHSLDAIYDYEVVGVWQQDQTDEAAKYGKEPGDFRLRDVNGDGELTPVEDKVFLGHTKPRYRFGLNNVLRLRNFKVSALLTSHLGQQRPHNWHKHTSWTIGRLNQLDYPYWTSENPVNRWARLNSNDSPGFNYWEKSSFVRLQNLSVSYQLPQRYVGSLDGNSFQVFFNARNVFVLTGFDGRDPETGGNTPRLYSLGINMSF